MASMRWSFVVVLVARGGEKAKSNAAPPPVESSGDSAVFVGCAKWDENNEAEWSCGDVAYWSIPDAKPVKTLPPPPFTQALDKVYRGTDETPLAGADGKPFAKAGMVATWAAP